MIPHSASTFKIAILGASLETSNLGVSALATGAVKCIRNAYPTAEVYFLDYAREGCRRSVYIEGRWVPVRLLPIRFSLRFWLPNHIAVLLGWAVLLRLLPVTRLRAWVLRRNHALHEICATDLYCSLAGGDSFSDLYGAVRFVYCALPQILALVLGKPLVLLPQTYGPFRSSMLRWIAQKIVCRAQSAWCRDRNSLAALMGWAPGVQAWTQQAFCCDLAFALDACPPPRGIVEGLELPAVRDANLIGVNVSGLLYRGGYRGQNQFALKSNYPRLIRTVLELLLSYPATRVLLVPHVFGADRESDLAACEEIYRELGPMHGGRIGLLRNLCDPCEIRHVIGLCGFFVGSRMHASIAAVSQGVVAVSIAYSDKFAAVMSAVSCEGLVADARTLSQLQVLAAIQEAYRRRIHTAQELQRRMPVLREQVLRVLHTEPQAHPTLQSTPIPA